MILPQFSFQLLGSMEFVSCSKLYFEIVRGPRSEPTSWPLDLGNFEYRSELGIKESLNAGFCTEARE